MLARQWQLFLKRVLSRLKKEVDHCAVTYLQDSNPLYYENSKLRSILALNVTEQTWNLPFISNLTLIQSAVDNATWHLILPLISDLNLLILPVLKIYTWRHWRVSEVEYIIAKHAKRFRALFAVGRTSWSGPISLSSREKPERDCSEIVLAE